MPLSYYQMQLNMNININQKYEYHACNTESINTTKNEKLINSKIVLVVMKPNSSFLHLTVNSVTPKKIGFTIIPKEVEETHPQNI